MTTEVKKIKSKLLCETRVIVQMCRKYMNILVCIQSNAITKIKPQDVWKVITAAVNEAHCTFKEVKKKE